jgi:hypothetical protein
VSVCPLANCSPQDELIPTDQNHAENVSTTDSRNIEQSSPLWEIA